MIITLVDGTQEDITLVVQAFVELAIQRQRGDDPRKEHGYRHTHNTAP